MRFTNCRDYFEDTLRIQTVTILLQLICFYLYITVYLYGNTISYVYVLLRNIQHVH